jgi:hypothetical protein
VAGADTKWIDLRDEIRDRKKSEASEQQRQQAEWTKAQRHWSEISEKAEREQPGFNEGVDALIRRGHVSPALGRTIVQEAVDAPEAAVSVARYLTQKPEEAKRISALSEQRTVLAVGRFIERFTNPVIQNSGTAATKQPAVPAKTTVLNGSGVQGKKLGDLNDHTRTPSTQSEASSGETLGVFRRAEFICQYPTRDIRVAGLAPAESGVWRFY